MIDCHAHLALSDFDPDRSEVLRRASQAGVTGIVVVGEDLDDNRRVLDVCRSQPQILKPCAGLHPDRFAEDRQPPGEEEIESVCSFARRHRFEILAIGEVGLDYWQVKSTQRRTLQLACFERMVALAGELNLALNVHSRSAGHYTLDALAACKAGRVLLHAFDGKAGYALKAAETHGWLFSIPPSVVRSAQKQKLVRSLPLDALALESDSPVLGPDRNRRNEPANLAFAVSCIAEIKGVSQDQVKEVTSRNALQLFGL